MKIRTTLKGGTADVEVFMRHPMETGMRKNFEGEIVPRQFIKNVVVTHNGRTVLEAHWGTAVSRNPIFGFRIKGAQAGDKIAVAWVDSKGEKRMDEVAVAAAS
jgi:sulfur-oxidizing protein SoxZ